MYVADDAPGTAKKQLHDATWGHIRTLSLPSYIELASPTRLDAIMTFMKSMGSWLAVYFGTWFRSQATC